MMRKTSLPYPASKGPASKGTASSESGSAYVVVLLVLVVLTILGLSLVLVTQTERQIGSSEKTVQRVFATADSGVALAVAKSMVLKDNQPMRLSFRESRTRLDGSDDPTLASQSFLLRHDLETSALVPMLDSPCHLCQINSGGNTDIAYKSINHGLVSTATRRGWLDGGDADDAQSFGQQRVTSMVQIQPIQGTADPLYQGDVGEQSTYGTGGSMQQVGF